MRVVQKVSNKSEVVENFLKSRTGQKVKEIFTLEFSFGDPPGRSILLPVELKYIYGNFGWHQRGSDFAYEYIETHMPPVFTKRTSQARKISNSRCRYSTVLIAESIALP